MSGPPKRTIIDVDFEPTSSTRPNTRSRKCINIDVIDEPSASTAPPTTQKESLQNSNAALLLLKSLSAQLQACQVKLSNLPDQTKAGIEIRKCKSSLQETQRNIEKTARSGNLLDTAALLQTRARHQQDLIEKMQHRIQVITFNIDILNDHNALMKSFSATLFGLPELLRQAVTTEPLDDDCIEVIQQPVPLSPAESESAAILRTTYSQLKSEMPADLVDYLTSVRHKLQLALLSLQQQISKQAASQTLVKQLKNSHCRLLSVQSQVLEHSNQIQNEIGNGAIPCCQTHAAVGRAIVAKAALESTLLSSVCTLESHKGLVSSIKNQGIDNDIAIASASEDFDLDKALEENLSLPYQVKNLLVEKTIKSSLFECSTLHTRLSAVFSFLQLLRQNPAQRLPLLVIRIRDASFSKTTSRVDSVLRGITSMSPGDLCRSLDLSNESETEAFTLADVAPDIWQQLCPPRLSEALTTWVPEQQQQPLTLEVIGRMLAKCIIEAVPVPVPFATAVLAALCTDDNTDPEIYGDLGASLFALCEVEPEQGRAFLQVLLDRCTLSPALLLDPPTPADLTRTLSYAPGPDPLTLSVSLTQALATFDPVGTSAIRRACKERLYGRIGPHVTHIRKGFRSVEVLCTHLKLLRPAELAQLISGFGTHNKGSFKGRFIPPSLSTTASSSSSSSSSSSLSKSVTPFSISQACQHISWLENHLESSPSIWSVLFELKVSGTSSVFCDQDASLKSSVSLIASPNPPIYICSRERAPAALAPAPPPLTSPRSTRRNHTQSPQPQPQSQSQPPQQTPPQAPDTTSDVVHLSTNPSLVVTFPPCSSQAVLVSVLTRFLLPTSEAGNSAKICIVCRDSCSDIGVLCGTDAMQAENRHFVCNKCFEAYVRDESNKDIADLQKRKGGRIFCPMRLHGCKTEEPFANKVIAEHVSGDTFDAYLKAQSRVVEQRVVTEMERTVGLRVATETKNAEIERLKHQIENTILTLACPSCNAAFLEFDGCLSVKCGSCAAYFCGLCQHQCCDSQQCHAHALACKHNPSKGTSYFLQVEQVRSIHVQIKKQRLVTFVADLQSDETRTTVLNLLASELAELKTNAKHILKQVKTNPRAKAQ